MSYHVGLSGEKALTGQMHTDETGAAASINSHAGSANVKKIRESVGHDRSTVTSGAILRLIIVVTENNLFVIFIWSWSASIR